MTSPCCLKTPVYMEIAADYALASVFVIVFISSLILMLLFIHFNAGHESQNRCF